MNGVVFGLIFSAGVAQVSCYVMFVRFSRVAVLMWGIKKLSSSICRVKRKQGRPTKSLSENFKNS